MKTKLFKYFKTCAILLSLLLIFEQSGFAQIAGQLDISHSMSSLRSYFSQDRFRPVHLRYLQYNIRENDFRLLLDRGNLGGLSSARIKNSTQILLNYFLTGVALPNGSFWVNLKPGAKNEVIDPLLGQTDIGKVLLETDVQLKKDTARFTSPTTTEGKEYWEKLYKRAGEIYGSQDVAIPTLTRPWIVPGEIIIREAGDNAYIYKATLKVMLEEDYLKGSPVYGFSDEWQKELNSYASQVLREKIIPRLTQEVNTSKRYAGLRQVYYSLILAQWFKQRFSKQSVAAEPSGLYSALIDSRDLKGLMSKKPWSVKKYFEEYQKSFKDGEYNFKMPVSTRYGKVIRSYFSGGIALDNMVALPGQSRQLPSGGVSVSIASSRPGGHLLRLKTLIAIKVDASQGIVIDESASTNNSGATDPAAGQDERSEEGKNAVFNAMDAIAEEGAPSDMEEVARIRDAYFVPHLKEAPANSTQEEFLRHYLPKVQSGIVRLFVVRSFGKIIGYSLSRKIKGFGWIYEVAVDPAYRGQGLGTKLFKAALDYITLGLDRITIITTSDWSVNGATRAMAMKFGFTESADKEHLTLKVRPTLGKTQLTSGDYSYEGKEGLNTLRWKQAWVKGRLVNIDGYLSILQNPAMGPDFRVPQVRLTSRKEMDKIAPGVNVLRQENQVLVVREYWNKLAKGVPLGAKRKRDSRLNLLMHEAMADLLERRGIPAEDIPMMIEGLLKDQGGLIHSKDKKRQDAHQGLRVDNSMDGEVVFWEKQELTEAVPLKGVVYKVIPIGDLHATLDAVRETFAGLGLIKKGLDENGIDDEFIAENVLVVQLGDVIDRGPKPIETLKWLRNMQEKATARRSYIARLLGNHELFYLLRHAKGRWVRNGENVIEVLKVIGDRRLPGGLAGIDNNLWANDAELIRFLKEDILQGRVVFAYGLGGKVFSHGVVKRELLEELSQELGLSSTQPLEDPAFFANTVNKILQAAVSDPDQEFESSIFSLSNGLTSNYLSNVSDVDGLPFDQVVGHDPRPFNYSKKIPAIKGAVRSIIGVDVGMAGAYGSGRGAVIFEDNKVYAVYPKGENASQPPLAANVIQDIKEDIFSGKARLQKGDIIISLSGTERMVVSVDGDSVTYIEKKNGGTKVKTEKMALSRRDAWVSAILRQMHLTKAESAAQPALTHEDWAKGKKPQGYIKTSPLVAELKELGISSRGVIDRGLLDEWAELVSRISTYSGELSKEQAQRMAELSQIISQKLQAAINRRRFSGVSERGISLQRFEEEAIDLLSNPDTKTDPQKVKALVQKGSSDYKVMLWPVFSMETEEEGPREVLKIANYVQGRIRDLIESLVYELSLNWQQARKLDRVAVNAYELCYNLVKHGKGGILTFRRIEQDGKLIGFEIVARDMGSGFEKLPEQWALSREKQARGEARGHGLSGLADSVFAKYGEIEIETNVGGRALRYNYNPEKQGLGESESGTLAKGTRVRLTLFTDALAKEKADADHAFEGEIDSKNNFAMPAQAVDKVVAHGIVDFDLGQVWAMGEVVDINNYLSILQNPAMGPDFRVPQVRLTSRKEMDKIAPGVNVLRQENQVLVVREYWNKLAKGVPLGAKRKRDSRLNLLMHEAMADLLERRGIPAEDIPMMIEGLLKDQGGLIHSKDKKRQDAHQGLRVDNSMDGEGKSGGVSVGKTPKIMQEFLDDLKGTPAEQKVKGWFSYPLTVEEVDPLYRKLAGLKGHDIVIAGGSDLAQLLMGQAKVNLHPENTEINLLVAKGDIGDPEKEWTFYESDGGLSGFGIPAYKERPEMRTAMLMANAEASRGYMKILQNLKEGKPMIDGWGQVNVPLIHTAIAVIPAQGPATIYFRTEQDLLNYRERRLTLLDISREWALEERNRPWLEQILEYSAINYARGKRDGWHFDRKTLEGIRYFVSTLSEDEKEEITSQIMDAAREASIAEERRIELAEDLKAVLSEFGFIDSPFSKGSASGGTEEIKGMGGIDLRVLPIAVKPAHLPVGLVSAASTSNNTALIPSPALDKEWQEIENMLNNGILPSLERIKEYLTLSCKSADCQARIEQVLGGIAYILRLEEERAAYADIATRQMLVLLEENLPANELDVALARVEVIPREPVLINK